MKILVDMNLSPRWKEALGRAGFESVWWREVGRPDAPDEELLQWAKEKNYLVLTADLDFGRLLSLGRSQGPSVILLRLSYTEPPEALTPVLGVLTRFKDELELGALVVVEEEGSRVRILSAS